MKRGDTITVTATIDAFKYGLNSGKKIRVNINGTLMWIPIELTNIEQCEEEEDVLKYVKEEMSKRCVGLGNRSIDDGFDTMVKYGRKENNNEE